MNKWLQRWQGMAAREQWLTYCVGLALLGVCYLLLIGDPLSTAVASREAAAKLAEGRALEAANGLAELDAKLKADPNIPYRSALLVASATREDLIRQVDTGTAELVTPEKMKAVLESLLKAQQGLSLMGMQSFSEPVQLPQESKPAAVPAVEAQVPTDVTLYRHGLVLELEGGYFDLLQYLAAVQLSGWKLNWDSLDYEVGEAGPSRAKISLKLFTLSRKAGWVGV
ncbi:type II secretion system protein GspM [Pseudomonas sp. Gutcm_11s]|uniref:type II secretion system protein GspM n=1 Tax=Pseudomonas sp. Gutcm_11s TaxID=3026088 RepID=UPI002362C01A|nr:type II secretion system protein GspM [Pseudomonas sp. Gutcm_11s]MDD0842158.1 type II secretion system protein GspM [Pseudomonas sp. Gutcm_11s]